MCGGTAHVKCGVRNCQLSWVNNYTPNTSKLSCHDYLTSHTDGVSCDDDMAVLRMYRLDWI